MFGMGTGGTLAVNSPANLRRIAGVRARGRYPERVREGYGYAFRTVKTAHAILHNCIDWSRHIRLT